MGRVKTDLTVVGIIPAATYTGTVIKLDYQIKTGEKWNSDGTSNVSFEDFDAAPDADLKRLHYTVAIPGQTNHFNDLYQKESALGFTQGFMKACGVDFDSTGFDPDDAVGKQITIEVGTDDDAEYGIQNTFKYSRV